MPDLRKKKKSVCTDANTQTLSTERESCYSNRHLHVIFWTYRSFRFQGSFCVLFCGVLTPEEFKAGFILLSLDGLTLAIKCCSRQAVGWRRRGVGWVGVNSASLLALPPTFLLDPLCLPPQRCQFCHVIFVAMLHVKLTRSAFRVAHLNLQ